MGGPSLLETGGSEANVGLNFLVVLTFNNFLVNQEFLKTLIGHRTAVLDPAIAQIFNRGLMS